MLAGFASAYSKWGSWIEGHMSRTALERVLRPCIGWLSQPRPGFTPDDWRETMLVRLANGATAAVGVLIFSVSVARGHGYPALLDLISYAIGLLAVLFLVVHVMESSNTHTSQVRRSFNRSMQGMALYGLIGMVALPWLIVAVGFIGHRGAGELVTGLAGSAGGAQLLARFASREPASQRSSSLRSRLFDAVKDPLLMVLVLVGVFVAFSAVSGTLLAHAYPAAAGAANPPVVGRAFAFLLAALLLFWALGYLVDANRISPHHFYRDRLSQAYLRTDARPHPDDPEAQASTDGRRGASPLPWRGPLRNVRDDDEMRLADLGNRPDVGSEAPEPADERDDVDDVVAPYHLLIAALNLVGSDELSRRTLLSDHFTFSRYWVGSATTGYVPTRTYMDGRLELASAMAISGAAAASVAGYLTSGWWSFVLTLFNARLGVWLPNPANLPKRAPKGAFRGWFFWPRYLGRELFGLVNARGRLVNVSDGGHTGDNLGLLPLLQRRCRVIVVIDGECDGAYQFNSFSHAIRLANVEEDIRVDIDLSRITPQKGREGDLRPSRDAVAVGDVHYPDWDRPGKIVYVKSAIPSTPGDPPPAHVLNYRRAHSDFPHQSTADQFFGDAQFEGYRALGVYDGAFAVGHLGRIE
jgi:hypothetical protein